MRHGQNCVYCHLGHVELRKALEQVADEGLDLIFDVEYRPFRLIPLDEPEMPMPRKEFLRNKMGCDTKVKVCADKLKIWSDQQNNKDQM